MESQSKDDEDPIHQTDQTELPHGLISEMILTRLPIKSILRFRSVSKLWYSTLSSSRFAFAHLQFPNPLSIESLIIRNGNKFQILFYENGKIDLVNGEVDFDVGDENMVLVGSCNGLVGLGSTSGCLFIIWNPMTGEFDKYLDSEISNFTTEGCMVTWGFGYVCAVDDYKIVRLCKKVFKDSIRVHVYSTRFDKMQRIDDNNTSDNFFGLRIAERLRKPGVLVNETLYWMGGMPHMLDGLLRKIISFDLASDTLDTFPHLEVSTPSLLYGSDNDECFDKLLCVVNGRLSKYGRRLTSGEDVITVLKSPGVKEEIVLSKVLASWMHYENLIGSVGGDKIFTQYYDNYALHLGVFDITSQPWNYTSLMNLDRGPKFEIVSYCPSLISINSHVTESSEITSSLNHEVRGTILAHWNGANSSASRLPLPESTHDKGIIRCCRWWTPRFTSKRKTESPETHKVADLVGLKKMKQNGKRMQLNNS
ncbi:F-box/kelch-repeat protein At3g06240-like isoform X2 [Silene latifolia]|uniref:F-box/kelch-repeat protein At3g06240-like isoform X2 n=1 Tax=Silene latifolia TaxID=37657 RepID=UPI003D76CF6F